MSSKPKSGEATKFDVHAVLKESEVAFFRNAYERLSNEGRCDAVSSMEYQRVLKDWLAAHKPMDVDRFIVVHANMRSDGSYPDYAPR